MKRIAIFHNLPAGGARRHTFEQVRELARRGYEIHEYTQSTADLSFMPFTGYVAATHVFDLRWDALREVAVPGLGPYVHIRQNRANLDRLNSQSREIARVIDAAGFDLVFVKDCRFTIAPYVLRHLRTPTIFYMHADLAARSRAEVKAPSSPLDRVRSRPGRRHEHMVYDEFLINLRSAGRVLTNSQFTRDRIRNRHGVAAHVVYPGVDLDTFYPRPRLSADAFVLSAGSLLPQKGHWFVIESLGVLPQDKRPKLIISTASANEQGERELRQVAARHNVGIEIHTIRDSEQLARLYSNALMLLFAPINEALGLVALEAMACGTPVVGVSEGGLIETIRDGQTGFLAERHPVKFAALVEKLLSNASLRGQLSAQARAYIEGFWTWSRAVDDLEVQFQSLGEQQPVSA